MYWTLSQWCVLSSTDLYIPNIWKICHLVLLAFSYMHHLLFNFIRSSTMLSEARFWHGPRSLLLLCCETSKLTAKSPEGTTAFPVSSPLCISNRLSDDVAGERSGYKALYLFIYFFADSDGKTIFSPLISSNPGKEPFVIAPYEFCIRFALITDLFGWRSSQLRDGLLCCWSAECSWVCIFWLC